MSDRLPNSWFLSVGLAALLAVVVLSELGQMPQVEAAPPPQKPTPAEIEALKKAQEAQKKAAHEAVMAEETEEFKSAYILLAGANDNYDGHKGRAMREIEAALQLHDEKAWKHIQQKIKALQNLHKVVGAKLVNDPSAGHELQAISDAQVAHAGRVLGQLAPVLVANKQPKLHEHVETAVKEIKACPKHEAAEAAIKGKEADVLTTAYILVTSADADYDGHRAKAMKALEEACNILEADILKTGTVAQKIQALKDAHAEALENITRQKDPTITEPQALSDAQLFLARVLIQRVEASVRTSKQPRVFALVEKAQKEIGIALTIK